ncbi:MAG: BT_3928 family protein [Candidatus Cyclobacteriaceae bacterium M2_1C_046]
MKFIDYIARFFVGGLFIFSGLVKINDPRGTEIKLKEYFEVFASDFGSFFEIFIPIALPLAFIIVVLELVLGVAVLIQYKMRITSWILLLLMLFFTFLTFYSAYFNKVTDCGCFGDAIPLDPWESFFKDIILLVFVLHLFWHRKRLHSEVSEKAGTIAIGATALVSLLIGWNAVEHLPYIDFRPYKVGNHIPSQMEPEEQPIFEYTFRKDGEEITSLKYLPADEGFEYVGIKVLNEEATVPKIQDYQVISPEGEDVTQETFEGKKLILVFYNVDGADTEAMDEINELVNNLPEDVKPMVFTAAAESDFEAFRHEYQLAVPFYFVDATVLKAMIRSNPGIILMQEGVVLGKWHYNDVPDIKDIKELLRG